MSKTEYNIGEKFQCGLIRLECVEQSEDAIRFCEGCFFDGFSACSDTLCLIGPCFDEDRSDNKNVIFKQID